MIAQGSIAIEFADYDWSTNDANTRIYSKGDLKGRLFSFAFPFSRGSRRKR